MTLENLADIASILSAIFALIGLFGLGAIVYKFVFKQKNDTVFTVHGDINGDVVTGGVAGKNKADIPK
jgi:hypothetical protein